MGLYVEANFWGSLLYLSGSLTAEQMILMQKVLNKFLIKTETEFLCESNLTS